MAVVWRLGLILFGFAAATLVAAFSYVPPAGAQESYASDPRTKTLPPPDTAPTRRAGEPPASERRPGAAAPDDPATAYESPPRAPMRGTLREVFSDEAVEAGTDGYAFEDDPDAPPSDAAADDEPTAPLDGVAPTDGLVDLAEPAPYEDGGDRDTRPPEDAEVFADPPPGYDPLLFQIEDIDPVETDRRPARLFRFEPYDPVGVRVGSFVFFPEAELGGLATSNVLSSPDARSDIAAEIRTTARLVSNWSVHAVELRGTTFTSFYDDFPSEDDRAWDVEARGRLDITRRTTLQGLVGHGVTQESRDAIDANRVGERADVTVDRGELALNHRFNRLALQLRGSVVDASYSATDGVSNRDRDTLETREAVRASWAFKPTLAAFAEQELNQRDKRAAPSDGIPRDSDGTRTRLGLDFGATGAVLRGTISAGYGRQSPDDRRLSAVDAFLFDANFAWRPTEITSFLLTAESDIYDTTTAGSGGVVTHRIGLEARHAFRRHLIASAGLLYTHYDYHAAPIDESELVSFLGAEYYASPELVLFARYQHLSFASNQVNSDYDSDEVRVGVRLRK